MSKSTDDLIARVKELAAKATPGPYFAADLGDYSDFGGDSRVILGGGPRIWNMSHH